MALPYVFVTRRDLARGIDTHSPKTALPDGYAEDLQNFDTSSSGKLSTRKGYEGLYGWLPFRATQVQHSGTDILLTLSAGVDVTAKAKSALVVSGRLSYATTGDTPAGDFTEGTDSRHWYPTWEIFSQLTLTASSGIVSVSANVHGRTSVNFWPVLFEGTPGVSATPIVVDSTEISTTTYDVDFDYTVAADTTAYVQYTNTPATTGTIYNRSVTQTGAQTISSISGSTITDVAHGLAVDDVVEFGTSGTLPTGFSTGVLYRVKTVPTADTFTVSTLDSTTTVTESGGGSGTHTWTRRGWATTSGLHGLNTQEILVKCWDTTLNAGKVTEVTPAGYYVTTGGTVTVYFEADFTGTLSMVAVPATQYSTQTAVAGANTYSNLDIGTFNYVYLQALVYNSTMSRWDAAAVDSYTAEPATHTLDVTLTAPGSETYKLCWVEAALAGNILAVTDRGAVSEDWTDAAPQLTVWGLGHADAYSTSASREGHTTHLDVYRRAGEATVVAGLGGNLFAGTDADTNAVYGDGLAALRFVPSTAAAIVTGRYFYPSTPATTPNDYVVDETYINSSYGWLCNSVTYNSSTHCWVLRLPKSGTYATSGLSNLAWVDLSGFPYSTLNGTFRVVSVDSQASYVDLSVGVDPANTLTATELARYNLSYPTGRVYCPYGRIPLTGVSQYEIPVEGDSLSVTGLSTSGWTVMGTLSGTNVYYSGAGAPATIPAGTTIGVTRTSPVALVEDSDGNLTAEGFVPGDMVTATGYDNTPRVRWVFDSLSADSVSITAWTEPDTVTWPTANLPAVWDSVWLYATGTVDVDGKHQYLVDTSGYYTVESVNLTTSAVTFTTPFVPDGTTQYNSGADWTLTLPYGQVCLDSSLELTEAGSERTALAVTGRWLPIEAPAPESGDLGKATWDFHLDANSYLDQTPLHSTTLNDALYATQGDDVVSKYDGSNLYRAGLPRWPLGVFGRVLTGSGSISAGQTVAASASSNTDKTFTIAYPAVSAGDYVYDSTNSTGPYLVVDVIEDSSATYKVQVPPGSTLTGGACNLVLLQRYRYYCKLTAVDANGFVTQSGAMASGDLVVDVNAGGSIQLQLTPPPAFGALDWDRLELEIYRTKGNGSTYFLVHRQLVDWDPAQPYITFVDGIHDDSLVTVDAVGIALAAGLQGYDGSAPPSLLRAIEGPPRAKVVSSLDNRLVLGNLKGWPEAKLNFLPKLGASTITKAQLAGAKLLFRRDSADTGTTTAMDDRVTYEFKTSGEVSFTPASDLTVTASSFKITKAAHGLAVGDWVYCFHSDTTTTTKSLRFAGWWRVASIDSAGAGTDFTISYTNAGTAAGATDIDRYITATTKTDVPVWLGTDGNWSQRDGNPTTDSWQYQAPWRLAAAINTSMRAATTTTNSESFTPWLTAYSGADQTLGECVVRCPNVESTTPEVVAPASLADFRLYVNDVQRAADAQVAFETGLWPSRLARSFKNFPEVFDNPFGADAQVADAVIDVNPADGQEITAIIPMFGESATGTGSQLSQDLLVFKTASAYLVNIDTRSVQRLNTRGQGCTAPRSVAVTQEGVVFANASGIYRLNRDYTVTTLGLRLSGLWRDHVNDAQIAEACGTHYAEGRRYKLAVPYDSADYADVVLVYDYDREEGPGALGAWTRYTNHQPVWWANDGADAYWASQTGDVFKIRRAGDATDYRDDGSAVAEQVAILRAEDFDLPGVRKAIRYVTTLLELDTTDLTSFSVYSAPKLSSTYTLGGTVSFDRADARHRTFRTPPPSRRSSHIQVKYTHSTIDETCVITGVQYEVAQLTSKTIPDSGDA